MPTEYVFHASARKHYRHHNLTGEAVLHAVNQAIDTAPSIMTPSCQFANMLS